MKVIITGATGMVGKGVLLECLQNDLVTNVLVVGRKTANIQHPKMEEIIHQDLADISSIAYRFKGYDACFFCIGISSFRMSEEDYTKVTHDLPVSFATELLKHDENIAFHYVSATGADSTMKSKVMWERIKGKAEHSLSRLGLKDFYSYRPAYIKPDKATPSSTKIYNLLLPVLSILHPIIVRIFPRYSTTAFDIGKAMIRNTIHASDLKILESLNINRVSGLL